MRYSKLKASIITFEIHADNKAVNPLTVYVNNQDTVLPASITSVILQCILLYCFDCTLNENSMKPTKRKITGIHLASISMQCFYQNKHFFLNAISLQNLKIKLLK